MKTVYVLLMSLQICAFCFAQTAKTTTLGSIEGVVVDQQGKPIPNMDIDVYRQEDMRHL